MSIEGTSAATQSAVTRNRIATMRSMRGATVSDDAAVRFFIRCILDEARSRSHDRPRDAVDIACALVKDYRDPAHRHLGLRLGFPRNPDDRRVVAVEHYFYSRAIAAQWASAEDQARACCVDAPIATRIEFGRFRFYLLEGPATLGRWTFIKKWALQGAVDGDRDAAGC